LPGLFGPHLYVLSAHRAIQILEPHVNTTSATPTPTLAIEGARALFFSTKEEFLAYRAAWRALATAAQSKTSGIELAAAHYAAHALLTGRDAYNAFGRNNRKGQLPYGALTHAMRDIGPALATGRVLPESTVAAYISLAKYLANWGINRWPTEHIFFQGAASFSAAAEVSHG
jgi:hypothetical protein